MSNGKTCALAPAARSRSVASAIARTVGSANRSSGWAITSFQHALDQAHPGRPGQIEADGDDPPERLVLAQRRHHAPDAAARDQEADQIGSARDQLAADLGRIARPVFSFLYANMNYHIEHHMFPMVPGYNLPKLHELIKDQCPPAYPGLWATYREIIPALIRQRQDPSWAVQRPLPETANTNRTLWAAEPAA